MLCPAVVAISFLAALAAACGNGGPVGTTASSEAGTLTNGTSTGARVPIVGASVTASKAGTADYGL